MLIDAHQPEDVFARVPELVAQIDPVLQALDVLLEDDRLYQQVRADLGKRYRFTKVARTPFDAGGSDPAHAPVQTSLPVELQRDRRARQGQSGPALVLSRLF